MLLSILGANLSRNLLPDKVVKPARWGRGAIRASEGTIRAGQDFYPLYPLTNFRHQKYHQNDLMVFIHEIIHRKKMDGAYAIRLD